MTSKILSCNYSDSYTLESELHHSQYSMSVYYQPMFGAAI